MFSGHNYIGYTPVASGNKKIRVFSTTLRDYLPEEFTVATEAEIEQATSKARAAFEIYRKTTAEARASFLELIGEEIMNIGDDLIRRAMQETGLPEARLTGERARTIGQLKMFAAILREGSWVEAVIDPPQPERKPLPRADLRKMLVPLGPVVVFGASNFPFAFSTAGGDTASALAAGCPVIVKAHSSHLGTNELVAKAILTAAEKSGMPDGVFSSLVGEGATLGQALARHSLVKAIGFTGSFRAGMALYKTAVNEREVPIPVYAEMSSINPVLILPNKLDESSDKIAVQLAASITLGAGQFCTNPGIIFLLKTDKSREFIDQLSQQLKAMPAATMLNQVICKSYYTRRDEVLQEKGVKPVMKGDDQGDQFKASAALQEVSAADFIANQNLQHEIFGPASLMVLCDNAREMKDAVHALQGQLTGTVFGTASDIHSYEACIDELQERTGRLIYNGVPTGVEVCHAMIHGGPFPATTDGRTTSVGSDAIKRFVRPVCFQDCPEEFLPDALRDENPLGIMRKLNGRYTRAGVHQLEEA
jgi:NADP-dependent aldehyde dehydrogenase